MKNIDVMIHGYLDGALNEQQLQELAEWIRIDGKNADYFARRVVIHRQAYELLNEKDVHALAFDPSEVADPKSESFANTLAALALDEEKQNVTPVNISDVLERREMEAKAKRAESHASFHRRFGRSVQQESGSQTRHYVIPKPLFYGSIAAVIAVAVAVIWPMVEENRNRPANDGPQFIQVATIVEQIEAQWTDTAHDMVNADAVFNEELELVTGLVKLRFNSEAEVVIEGPCRFKPLTEKELHLIEGRIVGVCDTPQSKRFVVRTANTKITDLGTEFGVSATGRNTEAHVFRGEVTVDRLNRDGTEAEKVSLTSGKAARINQQIQVVENSAIIADQFKRRVIKEIDLVDIVAGGDGTQGKLNRGLDVTTGQFHDQPLRTGENFYLQGNKGYRSIGDKQSKYIDGVFLPVSDGHDDVQLDSAGNTFNGFPKRTEMLTHGRLWAGNLIPTVNDHIRVFDDGFAKLGVPEADGRKFVMHSPKGVTFDLKAIRDTHKLSTARFRALVYNTEALYVRPQDIAYKKDNTTFADVWVFVDGEKRSSHEWINTASGLIDLDVELPPDAKFLTLVVTDGGDDENYDWVFIGLPTVELAPAK